MDQYYREKGRLLCRVMLAGLTLSAAAWAASCSSRELSEDFSLPRREIAYEKELQLQTEDGNSKEITILVEPRALTREESRELLDETVQQMEMLILGENLSLEEVRSDLKLISEIEGTPIKVEWELGSHEALNLDGSIRSEKLTEEGSITELTACLTCGEESAIYQAYARILPPIQSPEESLMQELEKKIADLQEKNATAGQKKLPEEVQGQHLIWVEKRESAAASLLLLTFLSMLLLYVQKDRELKQQVQARERQMCRDYAQLVSKLVLLMRAGMTIRNAWELMVKDYQRKCEADQRNRRYAYEEMARTCREIQNGVSEAKAYENFGLRCRIPCYLKLSALLEQNLKKGNKGLTELLQMEVQEAFTQRRELARSQGEEAAARLLIPMTMMLFVVMILILAPAGMSMQM